ncbi:MAG: ArsA family ATPase [Acidimicrobiales bacterium]
MSASQDGPLHDAISGGHMVICAGPGGVGKTTVAAALALQGARLGRRCCVITVDPAKRLADALGVGQLTNQPSEVQGPFSGSLHALMLDAGGTFDDLVDRYASSATQGSEIKSNRIYQNLVSRLSGTQEYMATEKLFELAEGGRFDLVVVDTPPTRHALDLLDAPRRLTRFLEHRLFRALSGPTRTSMRLVALAAQALLRTIAKIAGGEIVEDALEFFRGFEGMEEGFLTRSRAVRGMLTDPETAYVLVTSAKADSIEEAVYFADRLSEDGLAPVAVVVNRIHPDFGTLQTAPGSAADPALRALFANHERLSAAAARERSALAGLATAVPSALSCVPLFTSDVHDLAGLGALADRLFLGDV